MAVGLTVKQSVSVQTRILTELTHGSNYATLYGQPDVKRLAETQSVASPFRVATVAVATGAGKPLHPAYVWAYGLESADGYFTLYPCRYQEFWEQVITPLITFEPKLYNYFHYWGSRVYLFAPWFFKNDTSSSSAIRFSDYYNLGLLSLANVRYIISGTPLQDEHLELLPSDNREPARAFAELRFRQKLLSMLRGKYPGVPLYVYENREVLPRFFLAGQSRAFETPGQVLEAMRHANPSELRSTAYVLQADVASPLLPQPGGEAGEVEVKGYAPDRISLSIRATGNSILVATNSYSPFWRAWVDDAEVHVFPVDHTFQGVAVEAGLHSVVLRYMPPYAIRLGR